MSQNFIYQRFYKGGDHLTLFTRMDFAKYYYHHIHEISKPFYEEILKLKPNARNYFLWPNIPTDKVLESVLQHKIWNGITIHIRKESYVESFNFGIEDIHNTQISNYYLNHLSQLEEFVTYFQTAAHSIIDVNDKKILGKHTGTCVLKNFMELYEEETHGQFLNLLKKFSIMVNGKQVMLTKRQFECFDLISKGLTLKQVAQILDISPRSVESHLEVLKAKCDISYKQDFSKLFQTPQ